MKGVKGIFPVGREGVKERVNRRCSSRLRVEGILYKVNFLVGVRIW